MIKNTKTFISFVRCNDLVVIMSVAQERVSACQRPKIVRLLKRYKSVLGAGKV